MNRIVPPIVCVCVFELLAAANTARAAAINFDTPGDYLNNFNVAISTAAGSTSGVSESVTGGISGSPGSLLYTPAGTNDSTALFKINGFNFGFDGAVLNESMMFHTGAGVTIAGGRTLQLGFGGNLNSTFNGSAQQPQLGAWTSVRVNTTTTSGSYTFEGQEKPIGIANTGATAFGGITISLTNNNWYRLSLTLTNLAGAGNYSITGIIQDFGADGVTGGATVATFPVTNRTIADLDTTLFGGFRTATNNSNATNYDAYTVVPEPGSIAVLAGGIALLSVLRRRTASLKL